MHRRNIRPRQVDVRQLLLTGCLLVSMPLAAEYDSPWDDGQHANPKSVAFIVTSPERAWNYLISPKSDYADRLGVAHAAAKIFPPSYLRKIDAARTDLRRSTWGVADADVRMSVAMMPEDRTVTVVGQVYEYPLKPFPYPNTFAERQKAPWPWQMALAMDNLWWEMVRGGDAGLLYDYARELPCSAADDARFFAKLTAAVAEHRREVPPRDIVGAWRNLIRRGLAEAQPFMYSAGLREDTDDSWWAAHLLLLEEARRDLIYQSGFWSNSLRKRYRSNQGSYTEVEGRVPRTLAYELARRAARNDKIRDYERAVAGAAAASMFGETIFPYEDTLIDERRPAAVARVVKWFDAREADLRAGAEAEAPALAAAEERFASALCRK